MEIGSVVVNKTGKEKTKFFAVTGFDESFCFLANGRDRKLDKPKKKNLRHVQETRTILDANQMESDKALWEALKSFVSE